MPSYFYQDTGLDGTLPRMVSQSPTLLPLPSSTQPSTSYHQSGSLASSSSQFPYSTIGTLTPARYNAYLRYGGIERFDFKRCSISRLRLLNKLLVDIVFLSTLDTQFFVFLSTKNTHSFNFYPKHVLPPTDMHLGPKLFIHLLKNIC